MVALPALAWPAGNAGLNTRGVVTETALGVETHDQGGHTQATLTVAVTGADGLPATGAVVIEDAGKPLAGVALDAQGRATSVLSLSEGNHSLSAAYAGDAAHQGSISQVSAATAQASTTPDFSVSVTPATLSLTAGQSGSVIASVTPLNAANLTAPMFVTLSCSGLPDQSACTFTPENLEILPGTTAAVTSSLVLSTQAGSAARSAPPARPDGKADANPVAWAILLPGMLGLGGLAFGARRRRWLSRFSLLALVGLVTVLGATACAPRYNYFNHGPPHNLPTPAGNYTVTVTAQSSNGITAITHSTTMVLTVK